MFQTYQNKNQSQFLARTWQKALQKREMQKNSYRATGDIKKAKAFVKMVSNFSFKTDFERATEHVIFSSEALAAPLRPAYLFAHD